MTEPKESRQTLRPDDLQDVLDSAGNAARKGTQQFLTPPALARAIALPMPRHRAIAADFTCGTGELLRGMDARTCLGVDIDSRVVNAASTMPHSGSTQSWQTQTADFTLLYDLLADADCRFDLLALNPPFSLTWETKRFAALATSKCEAVRLAFKANAASLDSTLGTLLAALDRLSERGEGYLLCNESTAIRLLGAPDADMMTNGAPAKALRRHIWLWLSLPEGTFDAAFKPCVLYFARSHQSRRSEIYHVESPVADPAQYLAPVTYSRRTLREGVQLHSDFEFDTATVSKWRACLAELRQRNGAKGSHEFNLWIQAGKIRRYLTPFQGYSGRIVKKDAEALNDLDGQSPFALVMQKHTRIALLKAVKGKVWRVDPKLLEAVDEAMQSYHAARAPLYKPSRIQSIGWLDEQDDIRCIADLTPKLYVSGSNKNAEWHETPLRLVQRMLNGKEKGKPLPLEWEGYTAAGKPTAKVCAFTGATNSSKWVHRDTFDSEDEALLWLTSGTQQETQPSFVAGQTYPLHTASRILERPHQRTNAVTGELEKCTLHGQELVIRIFDAKGRAHEFGDFSKEERAKAQGTILHPIETLAECFDIPEVADVSALHADRYQETMRLLEWLDGSADSGATAGKDGAAGATPSPPPPRVSQPAGEDGALLLRIQAALRNNRGLDGLPAPVRFGSYQKEDIARGSVYGGLVTGWEPGLGKTFPLLVFGVVNGARRHLLVAPESLHDQICKEAADKFGIEVRRLNSHADFAADALLQEAQRDILQARRSEVRGFWITSYSQLGYNGADEWTGKENEDGDIIVSKKCQREREDWPGWKVEYDRNIGETRMLGANNVPFARPIRCLCRPTLATLCMHIFGEDAYVGCDEAVRLKADHSYTSLGVRRLSPQFRQVLTGTPVKNHLDDIFWLLWWAGGSSPEPTARFPYAGTNADKEKFAREFMLMEQNHTREEKADAAGKKRPPRKRVPILCNVHRLWKLLGALVIRRRKDDIPGTDIVPKTIVPIRILPGEAQLAVYAHHLANKPQFTKEGKPMNPISAILAQLTALRIAALCPDSDLLRIRRVKLHGVKSLLQPKAPDTSEAGVKATSRAIKVVRLADRTPRTPLEAERETAFDLLTQMMTGDIALDIEAICKAAPSLAEQIRAAVVVEMEPPAARSWTDHNPKQAAILSKVAELIALGEQVVVMAPFQDFAKKLQTRLEEAGVASLLLDGNTAPAKRGRMAQLFKQRKYPVLIGGIESMGEGHSFENASHLILPSITWALDKNLQAIDRVHRLNSRKPVTIYFMVCQNTVDERLEELFREKGDAAALALDGRIRPEQEAEVNLAALLADAVANFNPNAPSVPEKDIEAEWEKSLRTRLGLAMRKYREWHPPIADASETVTQLEIATALQALSLPCAGEKADTPQIPVNASRALLKGVPDNTLRFLLEVGGSASVDTERAAFEEFASTRTGDWRRLWAEWHATWKKQSAKPAPGFSPNTNAALDALRKLGN